MLGLLAWITQKLVSLQIYNLLYERNGMSIERLSVTGVLGAMNILE